MTLILGDKFKLFKNNLELFGCSLEIKHIFIDTEGIATDVEDLSFVVNHYEHLDGGEVLYGESYFIQVFKKNKFKGFLFSDGEYLTIEAREKQIVVFDNIQYSGKAVSTFFPFSLSIRGGDNYKYMNDGGEITVECGKLITLSSVDYMPLFIDITEPYIPSESINTFWIVVICLLVIIIVILFIGGIISIKRNKDDLQDQRDYLSGI